MEITAKQEREPDNIPEKLPLENTPEGAVVTALSKQVANAFVLYANYKHYHWQTYGPLFRDLHKLFDEFAAHLLQSIDEFAERVRMIGQNPPSHPMDIMSVATVSAVSAQQSLREMVEEAQRNELIVIREMRDAAAVADRERDPGTTDIFSRAVQVHEKHEWFLRDILKTGDGLVT
jgi:starvation-inducible DNA-binding protein